MDGRRAAAAGLAVSTAFGVLLTTAVLAGPAPLVRVDLGVWDSTGSWAGALVWPVQIAQQIALRTGVVFSACVAALFCVFLLLRHRWAAALFLGLSAVAGGFTGLVMKDLVTRHRPPGAGRFDADLTDSYPSGHTMVGIYLYLAAGLIVLRIGQANDRNWIVRLGWALISFGPFLGLTRIVAGAHWATDVIGGWAFGSMVVCACALLLWRPLGTCWTHPRRSAD